MDFLKPDGKFMEEVSRVVDYILLNFLWILFSIPVVTFGAATTAKYYVSMKLQRGEEPVLFKAFMKSFKENFKQATLVWIPAFIVLCSISWDWYSIYYGSSRNIWFAAKIILLIFTIIMLSATINVFPMLARFHMTTKELIKGALLFSVLNIPYMILLFLSIIISVLVCLWYIQWGLAIYLLVSTVAFYYMTRLYVKQFNKLEEKRNESGDCT